MGQTATHLTASNNPNHILDAFTVGGSTDAMVGFYNPLPNATQRRNLALFIGQYKAPLLQNASALTALFRSSGSPASTVDVFPRLRTDGTSGVAQDGGVSVPVAPPGGATAVNVVDGAGQPAYNVSYTANGTLIGANVDTITFRLVNPAAPAGVNGTISVTVVGITSGNLTTTTASVVNYAVTVDGAVPTAFSITSGALPPGLMLNSPAGTITGTPNANASGVHNFRIRADTPAGFVDKDITFTVIGVRLNGANSGAVPAVIAATQGVPIATQTFSTNGMLAGANPFSVSAGVLPTNLSLDPATGQLTGTPTAGGNTDVTIRVATTLGNVDLPVRIQVAFAGTPTVQSPANATATVGQALNLAFTATNPAITAVGSTGLPAPLVFAITNGATGAVAITGTPTQSQNVGNSNVFNVQLNATNGLGQGGDSNLTLTINPSVVPTLSNATLAPSQNVAFNYDVLANNVTNLPVSAAITGFAATGLPAGLSINAAGVISGTTNLSGPFTAQITATNAAGTSTPATFTVNVTPTSVPGITAPTAVSGTIGSALTPVQIVATNPPITGYGGTGLPPNVSVDPKTGVISGTPTAHGTFNATLTATNAAGQGSRAVTFTIAPLPPVAGAANMSVPLNTATTLDLAPFIGGSDITGVRITSNPAFGTVTVSGTKVTYTPRTDYFGSDSFMYSAFGVVGESTPATVTVSIVGRPDPTRQANVAGTVQAQAQIAQRFGRTQIQNFTRRTESLRRGMSGTDIARAPDQTSVTRAPQPQYVDPFSEVPESASTVTTRSRSIDDPARAVPRRSNPPSAQTNVAGGGWAPGFGAAGDDGRLMPLAQVASTALATGTQTDVPGAPLRVNGGGLAADLISIVSSGSVNLAQVTGQGAGAKPAHSAVGGIDFWIEGSVNVGNLGPAPSGGRTEFSTSGISFGVDRRFSDKLVLGVGVGLASDKTEIGADGSKTVAEGASIAVYGSYAPTRNTFIDAVVGAGTIKFDNTRFVAPINAFAKSDRDGSQIFASLAGGYELKRGSVLLSPYGRVDLSYDRLKDGTETGVGQFALHYFGERVRSVQGALGLRLESVHETSFGWMAPRARIEYRHSFEGDHVSQIAYADLIGGQRYSISTAAVERDALVVGIGADFYSRGGLSLGVDYQLQKTFPEGSSQGIRLKLTQSLDGKGVRRPAIVRAIEADGAPHHHSSDVRVDFGITYDDNVTRGRLSSEILHDTSANLVVNKVELFPINDNMRVMLVGSAGGDKFDKYDKLDRLFAGLRAELQYRASGAFDSPILALFGRFSGEHFESQLRRGLRASAGASIRYPITDRVLMFGSLAHNERYAKSDVFDTRDNALQLNFDYQLSRESTVYLGGEYRRGDVVSTGAGSLFNVDVAKVFVADDAYPGQMFAYKVDAKTGILTLGYNMSFGTRDSLDISWRRARSTLSARPGFNAPGPFHYLADQFSIVYLVRF